MDDLTPLEIKPFGGFIFEKWSDKNEANIRMLIGASDALSSPEGVAAAIAEAWRRLIPISTKPRR